MSASFEICYNRFSTLACNREEALATFIKSLRGLVNVYNKLHHDCESAAIYYDIENPHAQCHVALGYSLREALDDVEQLDPDLYDFFMTLASQAPFIKFVKPEYYDSLQRWGFKAGNIGGEEGKIFYFALIINAYVLSMPCFGWDKFYVNCYGHGLPGDANVRLKNICDEQPEFLPPSRIKVTKKFTQEDCNLYIYFFDHPPTTYSCTSS